MLCDFTSVDILQLTKPGECVHCENQDVLSAKCVYVTAFVYAAANSRNMSYLATAVLFLCLSCLSEHDSAL